MIPRTGPMAGYYINDDYLTWLFDMVADHKTPDSCISLLLDLYETPFVYFNEYDQTRNDDIYELRELYKEECGDDGTVMSRPFTALEMMISLSMKIENRVMSNSRYGNRTSKWFWVMLDNLGLIPDRHHPWPEGYVCEVIMRWLYRSFRPNGDGSPFPMQNPPTDMREESIWRQAMLYINENYQGKW